MVGRTYPGSRRKREMRHRRPFDHARQRHESRSEDVGFTLIEILIVIVVLAVLAAIVFLAVQNLAGTSAQAACTGDFKTVESAVEAYKAQVTQYPDSSMPNSSYVASASTADASAATTGTGATPGGAGINDLLGTVTYTDSLGADHVLGPWLKDVPYNVGHYQIEVSADGKGTIYVAQAATAGAIQIGTKNAVSDCSSVE